MPKKLLLISSILLLTSIWTASLYLNQPQRQLPQASTYIDDTPVSQKVVVLIFDPILESQNNSRLTTFKGWFTPNDLTSQIVSTMRSNSHNYLNYTIISSQTIDDIPVKTDGFKYTDDTYLTCLNNTSTCHPDTNVGLTIDYAKLFQAHNLCNSNPDEVWLWGAPYFGYWEFTPTTYCGKTIFVMGFNYERGLGEAIHDFGHRMEYVGSLRVGNGNWQQNSSNEWNKFALINNHCGNVHFPPGATADYQYSNSYSTSSDCDSYLNYPNGPFTPTSLSCSNYGCNQLGYLNWWLYRIPANSGIYQTPAKNIYANWWKYFVFFDETSSPPPVINTPTPSPKPSATTTPKPNPTPTPLNCRQFISVKSCDAAGCAWYFCSNQCFTPGTSMNIACPIPSPTPNPQPTLPIGTPSHTPTPTLIPTPIPSISLSTPTPSPTQPTPTTNIQPPYLLITANIVALAVLFWVFKYYHPHP